MTRPTEKQLAEALQELTSLVKGECPSLLDEDSGGSARLALKIEDALSAYRSAQQVEAGAAGGVREQFEAWAGAEGFCLHRDETDKYADYHKTTTRWAWMAWQASRTSSVDDERKRFFDAGYVTLSVHDYEAAIEQARQQGIEQANALWELAQTSQEIEAMPAASSSQSSKPEPQSSRVGVLDKAASSAQEPGWVMVPVEPTEAMHQAAVRTITRCSGNDDWPPRVWRAMLAMAKVAAPARLAGGWANQHVERLSVNEMAARLAGAAQVERKALSIEQIYQIASKYVSDIGWFDFERNDFFTFVRAIEAAHGIPTASTASDEGSV